MALMHWLGEEEIRSDFDRLSRDLNRLLGGDGAAAAGPRLQRAGVYPPLNIYDDGESLIVRAEVPGVNPADVDITVTQELLTIKGKRGNGDAKGLSYHRRERESGVFHRSLTLPEPVDSGKVSATCRDGILEVRMPRAEHARPRKVTIIH